MYTHAYILYIFMFNAIKETDWRLLLLNSAFSLTDLSAWQDTNEYMAIEIYNPLHLYIYIIYIAYRFLYSRLK